MNNGPELIETVAAEAERLYADVRTSSCSVIADRRACMTRAE
jgi:hypothetical protein